MCNQLPFWSEDLYHTEEVKEEFTSATVEPVNSNQKFMLRKFQCLLHSESVAIQQQPIRFHSK